MMKSHDDQSGTYVQETQQSRFVDRGSDDFKAWRIVGESKYSTASLNFRHNPSMLLLSGLDNFSMHIPSWNVVEESDAVIQE